MFKREEIVDIYESTQKIEKFVVKAKEFLTPMMPSILESMGYGEYYYYRSFSINWESPLSFNSNNELVLRLEFDVSCGDTEYIYIPVEFLYDEDFIEKQKKRTEELKAQKEKEKEEKQKLMKEKLEKAEYNKYLKLKEKYENG
jgi:hypothetical protein